MSTTVTDLFCGAGGSSSGAIAVPGVVVRMAANHWSLAIKTHNENHPGTDHDCADLSQVDPRRYPRTDILWASPECTNHSQAKGVKRNIEATADLFEAPLADEAAERSRATMWDVVRFAEHHRYRGIVVENVVDAAKWVLWPAWRAALDSLGYCVHVIYLNSMHAQALGAPAPQSRDRLYVMAHVGNRCPNLAKWTRPVAWCPACDEVVHAVQAFKDPAKRWGRYRAQYLYRCPNTRCRNSVVQPGFLPAAHAIDWSLPGTRIGDRATPLAPKTLARIAAGLAKYARPIHLEASGNTFERRPGVRTWPLNGAPLTTQTTSTTKALAYDGSMVVPVEGRAGKTAVPVWEVLRTQTTRSENALLVPAGGTWNDSATPVTDPMRTRTTRDTEALVVPLRTHGVAEPATQPLKTFVAGNVGQALVQVDPFLAELRGGGSTHRPVTEPAATFTASGTHHGLVVPPLVMRNNTGGAEMLTPSDEELCTLTTAGHQSLVLASQASAIYAFDSGAVRSPLAALPTQTTVQGDALVSTDAVPDVNDCLFRMLEPHEIQLGMAFAADYRVLGNKRERVRQLGNAVTPPAARDLIAALVEALTGDQIDRLSPLR
jgi:DNA (cytosine-5)-methyltransferase 1